jgi:hypothetical protein
MKQRERKEEPKQKKTNNSRKIYYIIQHCMEHVAEDRMELSMKNRRL